MEKVIHPRIIVVIDLLQESGFRWQMEDYMLYFLKDRQVTQTEVVVALHLGFGIPLEEADQIVRNRNIMEYESIENTAYQTFLYMFYEPVATNDSDGDSVTVRF
ncbi:MAG: hypothetical protein P0Y53_10665 [Candidatus Pseudobacter hemicellulosilyticus]|uniref:Uncharacterized protein n=1 Tax=Candidatus Pseudobacter hemicellulosilyticus TaxID=3121375 RepID=A0AAJ5WTJ9_9BACT|nr:MAG: hypothetical protein P0Y53_10665 [Pseudobacter sp.]